MMTKLSDTVDACMTPKSCQFESSLDAINDDFSAEPGRVWSAVSWRWVEGYRFFLSKAGGLRLYATEYRRCSVPDLSGISNCG